jgi:hypothetical protein
MVGLCLHSGKIIEFREQQSTIMLTHITIMLRNAIITYRGITGLPSIEKYTTMKHGWNKQRPKQEMPTYFWLQISI